ncbi:MAG: hypothetical protein A3E87_00685 [Gammaproteobacteria bacterium RIFCSPHIGHO2_12_FULL_35_23]|nr:MAG: hypothetical protein A3E87_00685 [Gammaproteobacteria bacterium RIFCSPHIGHO2_12_FULL_35_23]
MNNFYCLLEEDGLIKVSGIDAIKFLQGQITTNIEEVNENQSQLSACCTNQGRVISIFRMFKFKEDFILKLPLALLEPLLTHLKKFAIFSKVKLENYSEKFKIIGLRSEKPLELFSTPRLEVDAVFTSSLLVVRVPDGLYRYELFIPPEALATVLVELNSHYSQITINFWQLTEIKQGIPRIFPQTLAVFTPHDLNLPQLNAVSFTKGCYQGQEIIARMHYRGKLKQHLYAAMVNERTFFIPGEKIFFNNQIVGYIVQSCLETYHQTALLVSMKEEVISLHEFMIANQQIKLNFLELKS